MKRKKLQSKTKNLRSWIEIDTQALKHNLKEIRKLIGQKIKLMVVVKSNAYGHGLVEAARVAQKNGADWLGVDSIDEAIELRKAKIKSPILILGYTLNSRLRDCPKFNFGQVVYNKETVLELAKSAKKLRKSAKIHLKIETGTSRQGIKVEDLPDFIKLIKKYPQIKIEGVYTHFANIEDVGKNNYYKKQLEIFKKAVEVLEDLGFKKLIKHTACSAAIILYPETHFDMVRLGISYYGLWSSEKVRKAAQARKVKINLKSALNWKTRIAQVKNLRKGIPISYGLTEKLKRDSEIAVLPVGYWDGYDRKLSRIGEVLIQGRRCKVMGRVCMNMIIVDVTKLKNIKIEEPVTLLGKSRKEEITAEEIAQKIGTINYEVITRINPLIPRIYAR